MNKINNLAKASQIYNHFYPDEINVFLNKHLKDFVCVKDTLYSRFIFSQKGDLRINDLEEQYINTMALYREIEKEFMEKNLIELGYDEKDLRKKYLGLKLTNSEEKKLNIYFSEQILDEYNDMVKKLKQKKKRDFFDYASAIIKNDPVSKMVIAPSKVGRSAIVYIDNCKNYFFKTRENELGFYCNNTIESFDCDDLELIINIISTFINKYKNFNIEYVYNYNDKFETKLLTIYFKINNKIVTSIKIKNYNLIYCLEKIGLIDNLWKLTHDRIDYMPKECNEKTRKLIQKYNQKIV